MHSLDLLAKKVRTITDDKLTKDKKLRVICKLLRDSVPHYDWVGFYFIDKTRPNELLLGPFEGEPTEHMRIQLGKGVCGQAAQLKKTLTVQDVSKEANYLSCSPNVKSEIVTPIIKNGVAVGELDVDSHTLSAFTAEDEVLLRRVCEIVSRIL